MNYKRLELAPREDQLYGKLSMSAHDLGIAHQCAAFLNKKGWHNPSFLRRGSTQIQHIAFTTSMIVSYSRPFKHGGGSIGFPTRLLNYNEEQQNFHRNILNLRDKVHAHTDAETYNFKLYDSPFFKSIDSITYTKFTAAELDLFMNMISQTISRVRKRMDEIHFAARTKPAQEP